MRVLVSNQSRTEARRKLVLAARARQMRLAPTPTEERLFEAIRAGKLGVSFRRQVPVGRFIVDLLAPEVRLVVEVDGAYHARRRAGDARRDRALLREGYRVLRQEAELVVRDLPAAVARIREVLEALRAAGGD